MSNNIKQIRKGQGVSVTELAAKLEMSQSNLTKIENGQIELRADTAAKIAAALNVSPQALQTQPSANGVIMLEVLNPEAIGLPPLSRLPVAAYQLPESTSDMAIYIMPDDTMAPQIPARAMVIVDKTQHNTSQNGVFLLQIGQSLILRRVQHTFSETATLLCDNKNYIPQQIDIASINISGRVLLAISLHTL